MNDRDPAGGEPESGARRRALPSELAEVQTLLLRALDELEAAGEGPEPRRSAEADDTDEAAASVAASAADRALRALRFLLTRAWQGVARGDLGAPRDVLSALRLARSFAHRKAPKLDPASRVALQISAGVESCYLADHAVEELRDRLRLADPGRSESDRGVLRVLAVSGSTYLRRGEIHARLRPEERRTVARVGQILVELHRQGFLLRIKAPARGSAETAFYALSERGSELCRELQIMESSSDTILRMARQMLATANSAEMSEDDRRIAIGWLCTACHGDIGAAVAEEVCRTYIAALGTAHEPLAAETTRQILRSRKTYSSLTDYGGGRFGIDSSCALKECRRAADRTEQWPAWQGWRDPRLVGAAGRITS